MRGDMEEARVMTTYKTLYGHSIETFESYAGRLEAAGEITAPVDGWQYPLCAECGYLRRRETNARHIDGDAVRARMWRQRTVDHIGVVHPGTRSQP